MKQHNFVLCFPKPFQPAFRKDPWHRKWGREVHWRLWDGVPESIRDFKQSIYSTWVSQIFIFYKYTQSNTQVVSYVTQCSSSQEHCVMTVKMAAQKALIANIVPWIRYLFFVLPVN